MLILILRIARSTGGATLFHGKYVLPLLVQGESRSTPSNKNSSYRIHTVQFSCNLQCFFPHPFQHFFLHVLHFSCILYPGEFSEVLRICFSLGMGWDGSFSVWAARLEGSSCTALAAGVGSKKGKKNGHPAVWRVACPNGGLQ